MRYAELLARVLIDGVALPRRVRYRTDGLWCWRACPTGKPHFYLRPSQQQPDCRRVERKPLGGKANQACTRGHWVADNAPLTKS